MKKISLTVEKGFILEPGVARVVPFDGSITGGPIGWQDSLGFYCMAEKLGVLFDGRVAGWGLMDNRATGGSIRWQSSYISNWMTGQLG